MRYVAILLVSLSVCSCTVISYGSKLGVVNKTDEVVSLRLAMMSGKSYSALLHPYHNEAELKVSFYIYAMPPKAHASLDSLQLLNANNLPYLLWTDEEIADFVTNEIDTLMLCAKDTVVFCGGNKQSLINELRRHRMRPRAVPLFCQNLVSEASLTITAKKMKQWKTM